jgi:ribosomal protein L3 glutamine methyltransferase
MAKSIKYKVEAFNQAVGKVLTIRDVLRLAVSNFQKNELYYGHGTDNAYDEAVYLILHTLHLPLDQLEPYLDAKLLDNEIDELFSVLDIRISKRLPAPYITHEAICQSYSFYVDERVIIPRSYLAEIILNDQLTPWIEYPELVHKILDLCTGNGSLAVIASDYFSDSNIVASDISQAALDVAAINIKGYKLDDRITLCKSDLFIKLSKYKNSFDLILTNPPYVDKLRMDTLPPEYLHEPGLALAGGENGLTFVDKILKQSVNYLSDFGVLAVEMGDNCSEIEERYIGLDFTWINTENDEGFVFVVTKQALVNYLSS